MRSEEKRRRGFCRQKEQILLKKNVVSKSGDSSVWERKVKAVESEINNNN